MPLWGAVGCGSVLGRWSLPPHPQPQLLTRPRVGGRAVSICCVEGPLGGDSERGEDRRVWGLALCQRPVPESGIRSFSGCSPRRTESKPSRSLHSTGPAWRPQGLPSTLVLLFLRTWLLRSFPQRPPRRGFSSPSHLLKSLVLQSSASFSIRAPPLHPGVTQSDSLPRLRGVPTR